MLYMILFLSTLLIQGHQWRINSAEKPFPVRVWYTSSATPGAARVEVEADWEHVRPTEITVLNHSSGLAAEIQAPRIDGRRFVIYLVSAFKTVPFGMNRLEVSVRDHQGFRTVVSGIEVVVE